MIAFPVMAAEKEATTQQARRADLGRPWGAGGRGSRAPARPRPAGSSGSTAPARIATWASTARRRRTRRAGRVGGVVDAELVLDEEDHELIDGGGHCRRPEILPLRRRTEPLRCRGRAGGWVGRITLVPVSGYRAARVTLDRVRPAVISRRGPPRPMTYPRRPSGRTMS